jgi:C4-dicarboxylate-specific signal transduction histidine kinase
MHHIIFEAQLANASKRIYLSGFGLFILVSLYFFIFQDLSFHALGKTIFFAFCAYQVFISLLLIGLGLIQKRLSPKTFLYTYYALVTSGVLGWGLSGPFLFWFSQRGIEVSSEFVELVHIQFIMIIGIINSIPQFLRHSKMFYILNLIALYIGLLFLLPFYTHSFSQFLIVALFAVIITPQYLNNWKKEIETIQRENELQLIFDGFPGAVFKLKNGCFNKVNQYVLEKIFWPHVDKSEWYLKPLGFLYGEGPWVQDVKKFIESNESKQLIEHKIPILNSERVFLSALTRIDEDSVLVASIDIQDLVEARELLEQEKRQSQEKARLAGLGLMAGGIAHEINNPLAVIQSRCDIIKRRLVKLEQPEAVEALESLNKVFPMIKRITQIINSMRCLARDSHQDEFEDVTVQSSLDDITILIQEKLKRQNIEFKISGPDLQTSFHGKKGELAQVFVNAINNSMQAVESLNEKWIHIIAEKLSSDRLKITIQDSGSGISEEHRDKVMTPLFTTKGPGQGTGLGLALSRKIIEIHKGDIYFDHSQKNTTLVIELPISVHNKKSE